MYLVCNECPRIMTMTLGNCSRCENETNGDLAICGACALRSAACQKCTKKLDFEPDPDRLAKLDEAVKSRQDSLDIAEAIYQAAIEPIKSELPAILARKKQIESAYRKATNDEYGRQMRIHSDASSSREASQWAANERYEALVELLVSYQNADLHYQARIQRGARSR